VPPLGIPDGKPPPGPPLAQFAEPVCCEPLPLDEEELEPQPASNRVEAASRATAAGAVRRVLRTRVMGQWLLKSPARSRREIVRPV
jgi:hypothetical protein